MSLRLTQTLEHERHKTNIYTGDSRPTTGMIGQRCMGYVPDANGNLVRLVPEMKGDDYLGPGTYSPEKPITFRKDIKISPNSKRTEWGTKQFKTGPGDYVFQEKDTRITHKLPKKPKKEKVTPFLSCNLQHESWTPKSPHISKNRFPQVHFDDKRLTSSFASRQKRELFHVPPPEDKKEPYYPPLHPKEFEGTAVFLTNVPRFPELVSTTPAPNQYKMPEVIGTAPVASLNPIFTEREPDPPPEPTPGPGFYDTSEHPEPKPANPVFADKSRVKHALDVLTDYPSPDTYSIEKVDLDERLPISIQRKHNRPETSWTRTPLEGNPNPGNYNISNQARIKGGKITKSGRKIYNNKRDGSKLAFTTQHDGFIKRTYNSHYYHVNYMK